MLVLQRNRLGLAKTGEMVTLKALGAQGSLGGVAWTRVLSLVYAQLWGSS